MPFVRRNALGQIESLHRHESDAAREFLAEYHLATLSTLGRDGRIPAVPVGIT